MRRVSAKSRLADQGFLLGCFVEARSPEIVEVLGLASFDFAVIDREHAAFSGETAGELVRAATVAGVAPLIRVRNNDPGEILEALDLGAVGLHVPQVASAEDARRAIAAARFPPGGERGFNPFVRAACYGALPLDEFRKTADDDTLLVLHIEARSAVEKLDEILSLDGVDVAFLGPYDMSQTLGVPGDVTHPKVVEAMRSIVKAAEPRGVTVGCFANTPEQTRLWLAEGVRYLAYSVDTQIFLHAARGVRAVIDGIRDEVS